MLLLYQQEQTSVAISDWFLAKVWLWHQNRHTLTKCCFASFASSMVDVFRYDISYHSIPWYLAIICPIMVFHGILPWYLLSRYSMVCRYNLSYHGCSGCYVCWWQKAWSGLRPDCLKGSFSIWLVLFMRSGLVSSPDTGCCKVKPHTNLNIYLVVRS